MKIFPPRGMQDFLPAQKRTRENILNTIKNSYSNFGFAQIETPALENSAIIKSGQGGENEKLSFNILKRGLDGNVDVKNATDLALRYDLTLPLSRFYATNRANLPKIFKAMQVGPVWRAERPQKGRFRQFEQCDIDIIGDVSINAETELIIATIKTLNELKIKSKIIINDRKLLKNIPEKALIIIDKCDKIGIEKTAELLSENGFSEKILDDIKKLKPSTEIENIIKNVKSVLPNLEIIFSPQLVRGMGYYTGPIFEIKTSDDELSIAGGGRYDNLIGKLTDENVPAVGFSIGFERIVSIASSENSAKNSIAILYSNDAEFLKALEKQSEYQAKEYAAGIVKYTKLNSSFYNSLLELGYKKVLIDFKTEKELKC